jgi:two-component system nitrate/nitrite response regulator NarL
MTYIIPPDADAPRRQPAIGIVILSDVRFVREAMVSFLERSGKVEIVGAVGEFSAEFLRSLALHPDIALIDTALSDGLTAVRRIRQIAPSVRIVALALAEREDDVLTWVEAGVSGYIPRSAALGDVVPLLEAALRDEQLCSPRIASSLVRRIAIGLPMIQSSERKSLTQRELEIVKLVSDGLSNKEIAINLKIGLATTKSHVHNALGKLGLVRRGQAAQWMREQIQTPKQHNAAERSG